MAARQTTRQKMETAIQAGKQVQVHYNGKDRIIEPAHLFEYHQKHYVVGYCYYRRQWRTFRLSRVNSCKVLDVPAVQTPIPWSQADIEKIDRSHVRLLLSAKASNGRASRASGASKAHATTEHYPKSIHLQKMARPALCRSPLEEKVYTFLNRSSDVVTFHVEPCSIPYTFQGQSHTYTPDVLVHFRVGSPALVEVKMSAEINLLVNQAKFGAAKSYASERGWEFLVMGVQSFTATRLGHEHRRRYSWDVEHQGARVERFSPDGANPGQASPIAGSPSASSSGRSHNGWAPVGWALVVLLFVIWLLSNGR